MLKIWGRQSSVNVQKVLWTVRELALPHILTAAGGAHGGLDTPEFLRMNPNRQIPVIDDGGFVLWESNAIVRYLSARYGEGTLSPAGHVGRADADRWMDWQATEWQPSMLRAFLGLVRTPEAQRDAAAIQASFELSVKRAMVLEDALQGKDYVTGSRFTMADIVLGCAAHRWLGLPGVQHPPTPAISAWYRRLMMRPATQGVLTLPLA
ncbi:glutathione S-transferase family protein [Bordetella genomosp. 13]|uniref:Glutathione S-transferase n=1 Tax=Bordetella genomosp. 13 TaxID=463040 RepID=A0A1W6Z7R0_9BORD|nr:glutathione S-transferase [Bordetella genomosp. 13]ARP93389.1 glutathione S-transferase [Bordetella genomosp. 13]